MRGSKTGTPDRFVIVRGQIIFVEVKKRGEKPTPEQPEKHAEPERSGAIVLVADSYDLFKGQFETIRAVIKMREKEIRFY